MKQIKIFFNPFAIFILCLCGCNAQPLNQNQFLQLITSIDLPGVKGRIDHLAFDSNSQTVFVAALGNNSVEVIDLKNNKAIYSIQVNRRVLFL
jgi:YVTN family beta-propeller protein